MQSARSILSFLLRIHGNINDEALSMLMLEVEAILKSPVLTEELLRVAIVQILSVHQNYHL